MSKPAVIPQRIAVADRDADENYARTSSASQSSPIQSPASVVSDWSEDTRPDTGYSKWRHTLGILLLLVTVFLWTVSNFLASTIFADDTYSKPYFVTYINTTFFVIPIIPMLGKYMYDERGQKKNWSSFMKKRVGKFTLMTQEEEEDAYARKRIEHAQESASARLLLNEDLAESQAMSSSWRSVVPDALTVYDTARLSVEFCIPWFAANYFAAACLEYTTVASATILSSTSSIWTLLLGSLVGAEVFTVRKLIGVMASLAGVAVISLVDISGENDENRGSFPHKSRSEVMIGDSMALVSAVLYGVYSILMKKRIGDEERVNMPLFFGFIGIFNIIALWPGFPILHWTKVEKFELPPTQKVTSIVMINSASSLLADMCWAFAVLLTSPLVVTVGLSLTIPLSLVGQMVLDSQYSSWVYWVGALIVVLSFVFINQEEKRVEQVQALEMENERRSMAASRASLSASRASIGASRSDQHQAEADEPLLGRSEDDDDLRDR